jgi:hypothetical protein
MLSALQIASRTTFVTGKERIVSLDGQALVIGDCQPCFLKYERFSHVVLADDCQQLSTCFPPFDAVCILLDRVTVVAEAGKLREGAAVQHPILDLEVALAVAQAIDR